MRAITVCDKTLCSLNGKDARALTFRERTGIAARLESMGVDAIVLPQIQRVKEETVMNRTICNACNIATVKIPVGGSEQEIASAWESIREAKKPCLQVVLPVSTVQMEYQYHKKATAMLEMIAGQIKAALQYCATVEFVALDASRAEVEYLGQVCSVAADSGAASVTLCDDAGTWMPSDAAKTVSSICAVCSLPILVCPSNVLHMATAVAIAVLEAGAAGIVTAAGDASCLSVDAFADVIFAKGESIGVTCALQATEIHSDMEEMQRDVGSSGRAAIEKNQRIRLTSESTAAEVSAAVTMLGYEITEGDSGLVTAEVLRVAAHKDHVGARDLEAIIATTAMQVPSTYHLESYVSSSGNVMSAMAQVTLTQGDEKYSGVSMGDGPIDAAFMAVEQIIGHHYELDDFQIQAVTEGRGAVGSALVKLRSGGKLYSGSGVSTDIIGASIRAYLNALNKIVYEEA